MTGLGDWVKSEWARLVAVCRRTVVCTFSKRVACCVRELGTPLPVSYLDVTFGDDTENDERVAEEERRRR